MNATLVQRANGFLGAQRPTILNNVRASPRTTLSTKHRTSLELQQNVPNLTSTFLYGNLYQFNGRQKPPTVEDQQIILEIFL